MELERAHKGRIVHRSNATAARQSSILPSDFQNSKMRTMYVEWRKKKEATDRRANYCWTEEHILSDGERGCGTISLFERVRQDGSV
jgi:hypothetical protein